MFYINGRKVTVNDARFHARCQIFYALKKLARLFRVCAEGDCGACTLLKTVPDINNPKLPNYGFNSCIAPVFLMDCAHIITVEGLKQVQQTSILSNLRFLQRLTVRLLYSWLSM